MTLDHRQHHLESLRSGLSVVLYPLQVIVNLPRSAGAWLDESFSSREQLQQENASLHTQNLLLRGRLQKFAALEAENMRLRDLLDSSFKVSNKVLIAELLSVDLEPFSKRIVINKGSNDGIYEGQPLLDADGVFGQIIHVGPISSVAMLITDPNHAIPVENNRNGLHAIAVGTGAQDMLNLPNIPLNADIKIGDLLVTSGLGGRFPRGYPVGVVTLVETGQSGQFARVTAKPVAHLARSREVLLVWTGEDFSPITKRCDPEDEACEETPAQKGVGATADQKTGDPR